MGRKKGATKTGGRRKGSVNKATAALKDWVSELIDGNRSRLEKDLQALEPKDRWQVVEKLMQYTLPKMASVDANVALDGLSDEQITIVVNNILSKIEDENSN